MSRWIDAEYCEDFFDRWESRVKNADPVTIDVVQNTRTLLRDAPSIDIVRCKECRYFSVISDEEEGTNYYMCGAWSNATDEDAFCSFGKRKE